MTVATLLESEAAYAENPAQTSKPFRLGYGESEKAQSVAWKQWLLIVALIAATAMFAIWVTSTPPQTIDSLAIDHLEQSKVATVSPTVPSNDLQLTDALANDEEFVLAENSFRARATQIEQSYKFMIACAMHSSSERSWYHNFS